jgi:hypothetical protein
MSDHTGTSTIQHCWSPLKAAQGLGKYQEENPIEALPISKTDTSRRAWNWTQYQTMLDVELMVIILSAFLSENVEEEHMAGLSTTYPKMYHQPVSITQQITQPCQSNIGCNV